ncbi:hydrogen peroxide-inducible genes activator [Rhizorhabdus sp.]|jgi:LysR family hydrogen peroxide-inducible transcriptional activator|uniref:hydrogen peroxide-inducible genes activator n=1 Tax=Rhizorhabdus sp. TaxID=1968843 RepID=UPI001B71DB6D|nr:hydrogen peroxide-inducible genes activator [Rhizorhabdus sp.]MBP8234190.1 LysR family transcriptional regulator [Rhizorhabdus sp.]
MNPTLRQLRYLVALADHGSFTRGAAAEGVSQPSFSEQIHQIERLLNGRIVERGRRAILTPLGRDAVAAARRVLVEVDNFVATARRSEDPLVGTIRLGVSPTLGPYLLPQVVARLHSVSPSLRVHVREGLPSKLTENLLSGIHDVILVQLPVDGGNLHIESLFREPLLIAMAADDPLRGADSIGLDDLRGRGLLTLQPEYRMSDQIMALAAAADAQVLRDYEGTSLDAIRQMAGMGMGLALLPERYVRQEVREDHDVVVRRFAEGRYYREIGLVWRSGSGRAPAFVALAEMLRQTIA